MADNRLKSSRADNKERCKIEEKEKEKLRQSLAMLVKRYFPGTYKETTELTVDKLYEKFMELYKDWMVIKNCSCGRIHYRDPKTGEVDTGWY